MPGGLALFAWRWREAALTKPGRRAWLEMVAVAVAFGLVAAPIALAAGIVHRDLALRPGTLPLVAGRALFLPALLEESLFRVMANPHPEEKVSSRALTVAAAASLGLYLVLHPLVGYLLPGGEVFGTAPFLLLVALLGSGCLWLYRRSGSLWPPLLLHWLVVVAWLALGGRGVLGVPG